MQVVYTTPGGRYRVVCADEQYELQVETSVQWWVVIARIDADACGMYHQEAGAVLTAMAIRAEREFT